MKKLTLLLLMILVSITGFSQSDNYQKGMKKGIDMMKASTKTEDILAAANHFERIANAEKNQWLPLYWTAYNYLRAGFTVEKDDTKDELYQKGISFIERAEQMKPDESEILTLKGYLELMYISVSPMTRAPMGTGGALELLETAKKMNPANPRPYLVQGQNTYYTPKFFGGGKSNALPILEEGAKKYRAEDENALVEKFLPAWGKARCDALIEACKKADE